MFWGLIMEPNKRYTQVVEKPFHISQAAMDASTGDGDPCQVMVVVDNKNFLICTLQKNKNIQVPLDLYFKTGDSVSFLTNGKCNVHLTGYLDPEFEDEELEEEEEDDDEEETPTLVSAKSKRKLENKKDETPNKKAKVEKKAAKKATPDSSDSDDDDEGHLQKILDGKDIDTDEDDESFKINASAEGDSDETESDDEEEDGEEEEDVEEGEEAASSEEAETTLDTSKEEELKTDMSKLTKSQRRRLKKKLAQQGKEQPQVNGIDKTKKDSKAEKTEKKKPEAKKDQEPAEKKEKKALTGGVSIEDTKVGSGPVAKPGKVVMVYYEGRLKSNNKMFDNCMKGPGFKFRLGAKEVISGWDVGINGMKVGGKRKIICPPNMAYGAKGSPPVIPPNSTLVFEVELKNVK